MSKKKDIEKELSRTREIIDALKTKEKPVSTGTVVAITVLAAIIFTLMISVSWVWGSYNTFIVADEDMNTQWSNINTEYQRRADLFINLAQSVSSYKEFEKDTLVEVTQARNMNFGSTKAEQMQNYGALDSALARLMVVFEKYPELKAIEQYNKLFEEVQRTENRIQIARTDYNSLVRSYNILITRFPKNMLANMWGYEKQDYFETQTIQAKTAPILNLE